MKEKVLILASVASMIDQFNMSNINILLNLGYEVHVACNFEKGNTCTVEKIESLKIKLDELRVKWFQVNFTRNVFNIIEDIESYRQVKSIIINNKYKFIHCHSPIGGVIGRLSCKATNTKCIYTAHGFHFFKGAPLKNWIIFYPIEKILSKYTDVLITINTNDYELAKDRFFSKKVVKVPGVGVDTKKFSKCKVNSKEYRKKLHLSDEFVVLSVGELNKNKNHSTIIKAIKKLNDPTIKYLIVGKGAEKDNLNHLINELGMCDQVKLLGFRTDIPELCKISDIFAFPSKREGLGLAAIEGMAAGLPLISSNINGINDYSICGVTGYSYNPTDVNGFSKGIKTLFDNPSIRNIMSEDCIKSASGYDITNVNKIMRKLYSEFDKDTNNN